MAMVAIGNAGVFLLPLRRCFLRGRHRVASFRPVSSYKAQASTSATVSVLPSTENVEASTCMSTLACPICYYPFNNRTPPGLIDLECKTCKKTYTSNEAYLDLTITGGSKGFDEAKPPSTELFRSPLVSFLYERGWRQNFALAGFPGLEKEFEMAKDYLRSTFGGIVVDASCGSGLFSRMFSKSGLYKCVIALDFSENMLKQCSDYIKQDGISRDNLVLVRADISRLPFESSSIDAVHAGAALHCWPSPSTAVAEISRVLRPGGVFVATTFIADGIYSIFPLSLGPEVFMGVTGQKIYASEGELEDLFKACGLVGFTCVRNRLFVMMSATKPT